MIVIVWGALFVCSPLFFFLNLFCKWKMKRAGWTDADMAELQRMMLGLGPDRLEIDRRIEPKFETVEAAE